MSYGQKHHVYHFHTYEVHISHVIGNGTSCIERQFTCEFVPKGCIPIPKCNVPHLWDKFMSPVFCKIVHCAPPPPHDAAVRRAPRCHKLLQEQCRGGKVDDVGGRLRLGVVVASLAVAAPRRGTARGTRRRISTTLKRVSLRRGRRNTPRRGVRYGGHQPQPQCERPLLQLRQHRLSEHPHYVRNFVRHVQQF